MVTPMDLLLATLGQRGRLGVRVADAVMLLAREATELGWDTRTMRGIDGAPREVKVFPAAWVRRLETAIAGGVFERQKPAEIVRHIVDTPEPGACA